MSKKILKFTDFSASLKAKNPGKLHEDSPQSILSQVLQQADDVKRGTTKTKSETSNREDLKKISISDLFYATSLGKKVVSELGKEENVDLVKKLKDKGIIPKDLIPDPEAVEAELGNSSTKKQAEENIAAMNAAGIQTAVGTDPKSLYDELISSEDYSFSDVQNLNWDGIKYILEKSGMANELNFNKYNLIGLRNYLSVKKKHPNRFVDALILMGPSSKKEVSIMAGTTVPGPFFMVQKFRNWWLATTGRSVLNPKGLAIVQPGVYPYKIGNHNGYPALVQNGTVKVERFSIVDDPKKANFSSFSPGNPESGNFGVNIHRGKKDGTTEKIDAYSAGCIVFKNSKDLSGVLKKMKENDQNTIDFVLVEMDEVPKSVLADASKSSRSSSS